MLKGQHTQICQICSLFEYRKEPENKIRQILKKTY